MGVYGGPNVSEDGLVLALDGANFKSFKGESVTNLYYAEAASSANNSIFHMPMGGTATGSYTTSSYGSWSGNTIFKVIVSAGTLSGGYESFRVCVSGSFTSTYGTSRRLSAKVKMLKGSITSLGLHNGGGTSGHSSGHYTPISEFSVPTDVLSKDGWYQFDVDVSGSWGSHCVGIGIVGSDIEFLVTEMMLYPSLTFVRFTPTTRGATVATGGGWADLTGNGNHGELVNGVRESSANGGYLTFDGSNQYATVTNGMNFLIGTSSVTFSAWIYRSSAPAYWAGIISNKVNVTEGICLLVNPDSKVFWQYDGGVSGVYAIYGGQSLSTNVWYNIVGVYDNIGLKTYVNGSLNDSANDAGKSISSSGNMNITIGAQDSGPGGPFPGRIANTSIYNRALSAAEIQQNFNALRGRFGI